MSLKSTFPGMAPGLFACVIAGLAAALPARADERGPVTNLPLPRFVSMKAAEANVRRGPSLTHRIDWVFKHEDTPLEITAEHGHWRRVRDRDGAGGWVHYSLLSGVRTAIAEQDMLELHAQPDPNAIVIARLEIGVIARIETCTPGWCRLEVAGYEGWTPKETIWGVAADEILE
ncbi:SH3 domain-containing protein [Roseovarius indicus]|uniref:Aspartyl-trna synthetase n=1 Tax=Roseovarius indicus TaxID=540747 RepID=A0A0T5PCK3_9RHOB|nr:SH3 domain-containing protein [Roseovarius indicus]KRS18950.1 aspartyl-trna synthetase [Roseovarius indicus]OAO00317.1 aspartyl-trna synthetase [Roseovarius indicus]QEW26118.1 Bacterial SH3 domain protein [Roseovarius indicus]SFD93540.1 SH3-like domain-containing protein [Roseovarius indicus]